MKINKGFFSTLIPLILLYCGGETLIEKDALDVLTGDIHYDTKYIGEKKLSFVVQKDDFDQSCVNVNYCNFKLFYENKDRKLEVRYTIGGKPVSGEGILYELIKDENNLCKLDASVVETDNQGIATGTIDNIKPMDGKCQVKVSVLKDSFVSPLYFNISVLPKGVIPLSILLKHEGNYIINSVQALLFKQDKYGEPKCNKLNIEKLKFLTATTSSQSVLPDNVVFFKNLPSLETEKIQYYTIVGIGKFGDSPEYPPKAWGCNDKDGIAEWNKTKPTITLTVKDLVPKLKGSYEIESSFDLVSGLPPNVATVINAIIGFFQSPVGEIMLLICKLTGGNLEDMCDWFFEDPNNPSLDKLTKTGEVAFKILNTFLISIIKTYCPYKDDPELCSKIYWTGKDVGDILKKFFLKATLTFNEEPQQDGLIPQSTTEEIWHTVIIKWTLGKDCKPDDENCGKIPLSFSNIPGIDEAISGKFEAKLEYVKEEKTYGITIKKHPLKLKYGALVNFAIEKLLLPQIFGDGKDGLPVVDSYEEMLGSILGGKPCLQKMNCCEIFAENLTKESSGLYKNLVEGACDALIDTGAKFLRDLLIELDYEGENFEIGTGKICFIYDKNDDMKFDTFGQTKTPCVWDINLKIGGTDYKPVGTFIGVETGIK